MSMNAVFEIASSAMTAQSKRLNVIASNLANVDSAASAAGGAYKAKQVVFSAQPVGRDKSAIGVQVARVIEDPTPPRLQFDPSHPLADARGVLLALPGAGVQQVWGQGLQQARHGAIQAQGRAHALRSSPVRASARTSRSVRRAVQSRATSAGSAPSG
jgi:flagellar basal-body rod protein FlgC